MHNETTVKENPARNTNYYQCWSRFSCPADYHIEYYFQSFDLYSNYNFILMFNADKNIQIKLTGLSNAPDKRPDLYKWYPIEANEIDFQKRARQQSRYDQGFKMRVRCAKNEI